MGREATTLLRRLQETQSAEGRRALGCAVSLSERRGAALYLVGGAVRDLLLGGAQLDVDLVVEGDALALAAALGTQLKARVVSHPRFGTAVVQGESFRLDLAQARTERYERPGALPTVRPARLADDLARRDFAMNAMALRLDGPNAGQLIDPHGGRDDVARRRLRVLHDASFQDDATRILRALRYAGRLRFRLEKHTESLLRRDLSYLDTISGARLRHEFERMAAEGRVQRILRLAHDLNVLTAVHPALCADERVQRAASGLSDIVPSHRDVVLFCLLLASASPRKADAVIERLALTGRQASAMRGYQAVRQQERTLARRSLRPSEVVCLLVPYPLPAVEAFMLTAARPLAADRARRYLEEWRSVSPRLNGRDVEALGVPRGPRVGAALALLREARLDGLTGTREDEVALIQKMRPNRRRVGARHG